jgi:uncharacterized hydrophobic protein (TIGR00271 family)
MLSVRVIAPASLASTALEILSGASHLSSLAHYPGASVDPPGDVFVAEVQRDAVNIILDQLTAAGIAREGTIVISEVSTFVSQRGLDAEIDSPNPDQVVWAEVIEDAYEQTALTPIFLAFMTMATLLAAIAVITDSVILVIGAMVLGPDFMATIAMGLALVRKRPHLLRQALRTLLIGFAFAILVTTVAVAIAHAAGLIDVGSIVGPRPGTQFIYTPNAWSFIVAIIAACAGVLAMTSSLSTGIVGVFISVTTIPAAGNIAVGIVFAEWQQVAGSAAQLGINVTGMAIAGWITLAIAQKMSKRTNRLLIRRAPR